MDTLSAYDLLVDTMPHFHGAEHSTNWKLELRTLRWLRDTIQADMRTLETGCGYSTVLFAAAGTDHVVVSPTAKEHTRIREWCQAAAISTDRITFLVGNSTSILPALRHERQLDLVLIDGCHAFPYPMIDWFYVAEAMRVGGVVVVDDTHIRACGDLKRFLASEKPRWEGVSNLGTAMVFRKLVSPVIDDVEWPHQPYCAGARKPPVQRLIHSMAVSVARLTRSNPRLYDWMRSIYRRQIQ